MSRAKKIILMVAGLAFTAGILIYWRSDNPKPTLHVNEADCGLCEQIAGTCSEPIQEWFETERFRDYTLHALEGRRTREEQEAHFKAGRSKALFGKSPHNYDPSRALDVIFLFDGVPRWDIWRFKALAKRMPTNIEWGGHWVTTVDNPHFQEVHWTNVIRNYPNGN